MTERVLAVEDDDATRALVAEVLRDAGYEVQTAPNGAAGLDVLRAWRPDLIVLDVVMPGLGAAGFREGQRAVPGAATVPVLLMSATYAYQLDELGRELGAAATVAKPFDLDVFLAAVAGVLSDRERR